MISRYKIVVIISLLLLTLSFGISFVNYTISMKSTQNQLKTQSLPLSIDNIYTEIQKHMIEPFLVASMMANDTFVKDWLKEESDIDKIQRYLSSIKNKYGMLAAFLVSDNTLKYYTNDGFIEKIDKSKTRNQWYFEFKNIPKHHEINLDLNEHLANTLIMFINFKMFDESFSYLGATGVGIKISYIDDMLKMFKNNYKLKVSFLDKDGNFVLGENRKKDITLNIDSISELAPLKDKILSKKQNIVEYEKDGYNYLINTKYIQELNIHLLVEAKLDDFTHETKNTFYLNMTISLILTFIIAFIIISLISRYHKKLERLANVDDLTQIPNRRNFQDKLKYLINLNRRNKQPLSLLFIDLDDFKSINDEFGHHIGDEILREFASILRQNIRKTDLYARWGGEEFIVALIDTHADKAIDTSNKIREAIKNSIKIKLLIHSSTTISCGVTEYKTEDTIDTLITRADKAMYEAKMSGKNRVCLL